jgi:hypothetical protein
MQPDPASRPPARELLTHHPRLRSKIERELSEERRRSEAYRGELVRAYPLWINQKDEGFGLIFFVGCPVVGLTFMGILWSALQLKKSSRKLKKTFTWG